MIIKVLDRASLGDDTPLDILGKFGEVIVYDKTSPDEVAERCADADAIIINKVKITREVIEKSNLKLICVFATGFDNIDVIAAKENGVAVCNVPGYSTESVALFTAATVLSLFTHLKEYNEFVTSGEYTALGLPNRLIPVYHELTGKTWGIIGYGNIGKAVARIASAFGARVIAYTRTPKPDIQCVDLDTLCKESDIITIHCPLNDGTREIINSTQISKMKNDVIIVNEARGAVVSEADIADAILTKKIGAYGCDVYSKEPMEKEHPYAKIMHEPNVLLTPHSAWGSYESRVRCINIVADNIEAFLNDKTLNRVDK